MKRAIERWAEREVRWEEKDSEGEGEGGDGDGHNNDDDVPL